MADTDDPAGATARRGGQVGDPAWDVALLFPPQGEWTEQEYLALDTNRLVELSDGYLEVQKARYSDLGRIHLSDSPAHPGTRLPGFERTARNRGRSSPKRAIDRPTAATETLRCSPERPDRCLHSR